MRRRRKTKYTWLFNTGTDGPSGGVIAEDFWNGRDFGTILVPTNGASTIQVQPLILDTPSDDDTSRNHPKSVYAGNELFIKRIVGKWWIHQAQLANSSTGSVAVTAGIFVARSDDRTPPDAAANPTPIGWPQTGAILPTITYNDAAPEARQAIDAYNPASTEAIRQPWIWRRQWIFSNVLTTDGAQLNTFPQNTAGYHSVLDGPHVDAKTARRIRDEERLWAVVSIRNYPVNITATNAAAVGVYFDYRVLGAARRQRARSAF